MEGSGTDEGVGSRTGDVTVITEGTGVFVGAPKESDVVVGSWATTVVRAVKRHSAMMLLRGIILYVVVNEIKKRLM